MDAIPYTCAAGVAPALVRRLVQVESSGNRFAIGVVGGRLARQPRNLPDAVATVRSLEAQGANYSVGISQVNRFHFARLGWHRAPHIAFDACANLRAGAGILQDCFVRAGGAGFRGAALDGRNPASRAALSCYYAGDFARGERLGYVAKYAGATGVAGMGAITKASAPPARRPTILPLFD